MPLNFADALYRHLLGRLPADRAYTRADLRSDELPGLVAAFLGRTLDRWVAYEREQHRSEWFDFEAPAVRAAGDRYFEALSRTARIPPSAWAATLEGAVRLVVRYLVTPARALTDAVFEGESDPLPGEVVRERLGLFDAYPYFAEVAGAYLERKRPEELDPDGLFDLLTRIDGRVTGGYGPQEWLELLGPLFALARHLPGQDGVPAPLLARFFEAKGERSIAEHLRRRERDALDERALRALLAGEAEARDEDEAPEEAPAPKPEARQPEPEARQPEPEGLEEPAVEAASDEAPPTPEPEEAGEPAAPPSAPAPVPSGIETPSEEDEADDEAPALAEPEPVEIAMESDEDEAISANDAREPEEDEAPVPLWLRFAGPEAAREDEEEALDPEPDADEAVPLWRRFAGGGPREAAPPRPLSPPARSRPPAAPPASPGRPAPAVGAPADVPAPEASVPDLDALERRVLGPTSPEQRREYVRHLTGGSEAAYRDVLRALDEAGSWTEAAQAIAHHIFRKHRVDIYSEHAVAFTDAAEARFRR